MSASNSHFFPLMPRFLMTLGELFNARLTVSHADPEFSDPEFSCQCGYCGLGFVLSQFSGIPSPLAWKNRKVSVSPIPGIQDHIR